MLEWVELVEFPIGPVEHPKEPLQPPKGHIEPPEIRVGISQHPELGIRRSIGGEKVSAIYVYWTYEHIQLLTETTLRGHFI